MIPHTLQSPPQPRRDLGTAVVIRRYLASRIGVTTPAAVRGALFRLVWADVGVAGVPSPEQVDYTRRWLEDTRLYEARAALGAVRARRGRPG